MSIADLQQAPDCHLSGGTARSFSYTPTHKKLSIPMNTNGQNTTGVQWKRRCEQRIDEQERDRETEVCR